MKKLLLFVIIFGMIAIIITSMLISMQKANVVQEEQPNEEEPTTNQTKVEPKEKEKTIDLYSTFQTNGITIEEASFAKDGFENGVEYPQIHGLKDKAVENKINQEILEKVQKVTNEMVQKGRTDYYCSFNDYDGANFSNILSLRCYTSYKDLALSSDRNEGYQYNDISFNYELIHGNELKFEDLFTQDTNIEDIARIGLYRMVAEDEITSEFISNVRYTDIHYDDKRGAWFANEYTWNYETGEETVKEVEYTPILTDYEIDKLTKKFIKQENKEFYFSTNRLYFKVGDKSIHLFLKDIKDSVVIFDKYLTQESIYESDENRFNYLMLSPADSSIMYHDASFEGDNLYYDVTLSRMFEMLLPDDIMQDKQLGLSKKYVETRKTKLLEEASQKIQEYRAIAKSNPQKAYIVLINLNSERVKISEQDTNLMLDEIGYKVISFDKNQKDIWTDILDQCRYYNLLFYGGAYDYIYQERLNNLDVDFKEDEIIHYYDMLTGKELSGLKDIFVDNFDYKAFIIKQIQRDNERWHLDWNIDESKIKYTVTSYGITYAGDNYGGSVSYADMKDYLKIRVISNEILPSSQKLLTKDEIQAIYPDDLTRAYNEPFARHGHDFKVADLKNYFSLWAWYQPEEGKVVPLEELTEIEKANVTLIKEVMDESK